MSAMRSRIFAAASSRVRTPAQALSIVTPPGPSMLMNVPGSPLNGRCSNVTIRQPGTSVTRAA